MASNKSSVPLFPPGYLEEYNGQAPISVAVAFIVLEVVCVVLRFWAQKVGKIAWGADDVLIIIGAIFSLAVIGCSLGDIYYGGVGYHMAVHVMYSPSTLTVWAKFFIIIPEVYGPAAIFPKLAILVLYLRIFTKRADRIACWVNGAFMVATCVGNTIAGFFACVPLNYLWNRTIPGGHCFNIDAWYLWGPFMNILTDLAMLIQPIPVMWKIQTSKMVKIGIILTLIIGSSGLITSSIVRFRVFRVFLTHDPSVDGTWTGSRLLVFAMVETGMYLIAACLPTYRPLALLFWRKIQPFILHLRSGFRGSGQPKNELGPYDTPNRFIRSDRDEEMVVSLYWTRENGPGEIA